jgi:DNA-binding response OmpR family regulator
MLEVRSNGPSRSASRSRRGGSGRLPGLELLDRLRVQWPKVPVVIISGTEDPILAQAALARGAADCVTKPFPLDRLREVVEVVLARRPEGGGQ